jgi:hypothetical protein
MAIFEIKNKKVKKIRMVRTLERDIQKLFEDNLRLLQN